MWGSGSGQSLRDEDIHVRVMGALAVGKTTLISTAVTRAPQKRGVPYTRSRTSQRYVCSVRSPQNDSVVAEIVDTTGNEDIDSLLSPSPKSRHNDASRSLLSTDSNVGWAYVLVVDLTRHETFDYARRLLEKIRAADAVRSVSSNFVGGRTGKSTVIMMGNKREMLPHTAYTSWLREAHSLLEKDASFFLFTGNTFDNAFTFVDAPGSDRARLVQRAYKMDSRSESTLFNYRFSIEQVLYLVKALEDIQFSGLSYLWSLQGTRSSKGATESNDPENNDSDSDDGDEEENGCCWRCRVLCGCARRRKPGQLLSRKNSQQ